MLLGKIAELGDLEDVEIEGHEKHGHAVGQHGIGFEHTTIERIVDATSTASRVTVPLAYDSTQTSHARVVVVELGRKLGLDTTRPLETIVG